MFRRHLRREREKYKEIQVQWLCSEVPDLVKSTHNPFLFKINLALELENIALSV